MTTTESFQPGLFDPDTAEMRKGRYRRLDPQTSIDAAANPAARLKWGSSRTLLLAAYREHPNEGLTYEQAGALVGLDNVKATRRCSELKRDGLIRETDRTASTLSGARAVVYQITSQGRYQLVQLRLSADALTA